MTKNQDHIKLFKWFLKLSKTKGVDRIVVARSNKHPNLYHVIVVEPKVKQSIKDVVEGIMKEKNGGRP